MVTISFLRSLPLLGLFALLSLGLAWLSRLSLVFFLKRVGLFIPLFTALIALPALFSPFTPGPPLLTLWDGVAITQPGLRVALTLILRASATLSLGVLLVLTTRWNHLLKALRVLHIPRAFVLVLQMTHRYIYLFLHMANAMFLARRSRTLGPRPSRENRQFLAASMVTLLARSQHLSSQVYLAMVSRGFRGEVVVGQDFYLRRRDGVWAALAVLLAGAAFWADRWWS